MAAAAIGPFIDFAPYGRCRLWMHSCWPGALWARCLPDLGSQRGLCVHACPPVTVRPPFVSDSAPVVRDRLPGPARMNKLCKMLAEFRVKVSDNRPERTLGGQPTCCRTAVASDRIREDAMGWQTSDFSAGEAVAESGRHRCRR